MAEIVLVAEESCVEPEGHHITIIITSIMITTMLSQTLRQRSVCFGAGLVSKEREMHALASSLAGLQKMPQPPPQVSVQAHRLIDRGVGLVQAASPQVASGVSQG